MGRWRPPAEKSSAYITVDGYKALESEYKLIWQKRAEVTQALSIAAAEGDRSENAEYIYRKKQLREIDRRITYLQKRMPVLKIISDVNDRNRIYFGAWVTLENDEDEVLNYRIVGADEIDAEKKYISVDAPLARALLGKTLNDEIAVTIQEKINHFYIQKIEYL